jgi:hypothetical protein
MEMLNPFISAASAYQGQHFEESAKSQGIDAVLQKPLEISKISKVLDAKILQY